MLAPTKANIMNTIKQSDQVTNFPRPRNLGSYLAEDEASLKPIVELQEWCRNEFKLLQGAGNSLIKEPFEMPPIKTPTSNPVSYMPPDKLQTQIVKQEEFRARAKA